MIVITGSTGQVGSALAKLIPEATALDRAALDLARPETIAAALDRLQPSLIYHCAAYTAVDAAEEDEATARTVNAEAVAELARWTARRGAKLVTYSTDYVFDGTKQGAYVESDATNPISVYGRTKLAGEEAALEADPGALVVRTSWVISGSHPNFVATMVRLGRRQPLQVVADQHGCPTVAADLAASTIAAVDRSVAGRLHLTSEDPTTWFELARASLTEAGLDPELVAPCATDDYPRPAPRPANSVLISERRAGYGIPQMRSWRQALPGLVEELLTWI